MAYLFQTVNIVFDINQEMKDHDSMVVTRLYGYYFLTNQDVNLY